MLIYLTPSFEKSWFSVVINIDTIGNISYLLKIYLSNALSLNIFYKQFIKVLSMMNDELLENIFITNNYSKETRRLTGIHFV